MNKNGVAICKNNVAIDWQLSWMPDAGGQMEMDRIRIEVVHAIELRFANIQLARSAAMSEIHSFFEIPGFRNAVKSELGITNDKDAAIAWAVKRSELWRPFDNARFRS